MADIILHRRSLETGSVPTTHSLGVAQLAINIPDGKIFIHKSSSVSESIVSVVTTDSITTGSITLTETASAALFIGTFTGSFSGNSSNAATASLLDGEQPYIDFHTASAVPTWKSGRIFWDNANDTLAIYSSESAVTLQVGQETWTRVYNASGATITDGTVVRLTGTHGDVPQVVKAAAIQVSGSMTFESQVLGVATHNIGVGSFGMITTQGLVKGLNTSEFNDGDMLYVSSSAGQFTNVAPSAPWEIIPVGQVVKAGPGASGIIYVSTEQPMDFSDLSSVKVEGTYSVGDLFSYQTSGSVNVWRHTNKLTGSYTISGSLINTGSIHMWQSASVSGTNIFGTASFAQTASYVTNSIDKMVYVSSGSGLDTNDGTALRPVKTISQSLVLMSNQGGRIAIHPGTYPESVTVTQANVTLASSTPGQGSDTVINGTVTFNASSGASKMIMLTANTVIHTGSANLYLDGVTVSTNLNKTGNGYLEIFDSALQGSTLSTISGPGTVLITNSKDQLLYISNSAAVVTIKDSVSSVSPTVMAGTLAAFNSIFYSLSSGSAAITAATGSTVGLTNSQIFNPLGQNERVSLGGFYSYEDITFNRTNSTFKTAVASRAEFQQIRAEGITGSVAGADTSSFADTVFTISSASIYSYVVTSSVIGTSSYALSTGSWRGSILNYTVASESNARAGQVATVWVNGNSSYSETSTTDIGNTSGVSFTASLSGSSIKYTFGTNTAYWRIAYTVTQI